MTWCTTLLYTSCWRQHCYRGLADVLADAASCGTYGKSFAGLATPRRSIQQCQNIKKNKKHFFPFKKTDFMVFAIMQPVLTPPPSESLALQVTNLSTKLWQVYLNDLCGPTQSTQRAAPTLQSSPLLTILCWVQRRWVSAEDSLLQCTLYSWKYNWKISEPQWLYA